jgi:hypothetical protein
MRELILAVVLASPASAASNSISALILGDWGGSGSSPYTTTAQKQAAAAMNTVAGKIGSVGVWALGDNFYSNGVTSVDSKRFDETFENVYTGSNLMSPWMVCAGNHDWNGNVEAQIEYSGVDPRWGFPSLYHNTTYVSDDGSVSIDLILIDTVSLTGAGVADESHPDYFKPLPAVGRAQDQAQWDWIEAQLKASTATYTVVGGHYPVYSVCEHGNTATLVAELQPLLAQYGAVYLSGHDHCAEYIVDSDDVHYVLNGMGMECCYAPSNLKSVPAGDTQWYLSSTNSGGATGGFSSVTATKNGITFTYYDQAGKVVYTTPTIAPK